LAARIEVNARSHGGACALFMASANGHLDIVKQLLQAKASPELPNESGNRPLHWAALNGHLDVVKALLEVKADANATNEFGKRPFEEAFGRSHTEVCEALAPETKFEDDLPADKEGEEDDDDGPSSSAPAATPAILGMGNPLLDISAEVTQELFDKYGLLPGNAILAEERHMPLYEELAAKNDVKYIAGGATQNSIRVAQWMLQESGMTAYMGCIGKDEFGQKLTDACKADGVLAKYMVDPQTPTGTCAVTILDKERSLTTNLSAANNYSVSHLQQPEHLKILKAAKIVYSAGFFITVSPDSIEVASQEMMRSGGVYCLNLSAPFIVQVPPFRAVLEKTLPFCDYLFGNETEAQAYAEAVGWESKDVAFIATRLSLVPMAGDKLPRKVVITQGSEPTVVAIRGQVTTYPVEQLSKDQLVDTNGAGDAFVGGFLASLVKGKDIEACCKAGSYAAAAVIQHSGCTFPAKPTYSIQ